MHLRILPGHKKLFVNKNIFLRLKWLKTCFDAFAHTSRPPETFFQKRNFWPSGVVKNVFWCIFAYFQTTRIMSSKKIFFNIWSVVIIWLSCLYSLKLSSYLLLNVVTYICLHWTKNLQSAKVWYFVTSSLLSSHSWGQRGSFS